MDTAPIIAKGASNTGDTGRLICRASGAPKVRFSWSRGGSAIPVSATEKYYIEFHKVWTQKKAETMFNNVHVDICQCIDVLCRLENTNAIIKKINFCLLIEYNI